MPNPAGDRYVEPDPEPVERDLLVRPGAGERGLGSHLDEAGRTGPCDGGAGVVPERLACGADQVGPGAEALRGVQAQVEPGATGRDPQGEARRRVDGADADLRGGRDGGCQRRGHDSADEK